MDKRVLGQIGENAAADVLRAKGYRIMRQNYRCRYGEQATQVMILQKIRSNARNR